MNKSIISCLIGLGLSAIAQTSGAAGVTWYEKYNGIAAGATGCSAAGTCDAGLGTGSAQAITANNIDTIQGKLSPTADGTDYFSFSWAAGQAQALTITVKFFDILPSPTTYVSTGTRIPFVTSLSLPGFFTTTVNDTVVNSPGSIFARSGRTQDCPAAGNSTCLVGTTAYNAIVPTSNDFFTLYSNTANQTPTFTIPANSATGGTYFLRINDNLGGGAFSYLATFNQLLNPTAVPEPGTLGLMGMGLAAAYLNRRRNIRLHQLAG